MESQVIYVEKSVVIHRDENGFGLRVGGQNPVFVAHVHENGAAWKAGVRQDDCIIKVNGTLVKSSDHNHVVHLIQDCTRFVNLTLHSPETVVMEPFTHPSTGMQSSEQNNGGLNIGSCGLNNNNINSSTITNNNNNNSNANNNLVTNSLKVHSLHQRLHPHSVSSNLNWLLDIGDDLFQDNSQKPQQQVNPESTQISVASNAHQPMGVSKLISSGPNLLPQTHQLTSSGGKPKLRHSRNNQSSTRDNPYYYYKTAPDKGPENTSTNSATSSLINNQDQGTSKSSASLSIVRSRSNSKMSIRSTMSGKYKTRNLRSRIVEDFRNLSIVNSQATPSSLSTSPSSSDLSDCDDQEASRFECLPTSASGPNVGLSNSTNAPNDLQSHIKLMSKHTTRRLEIIRELVETEKAHRDRLKHLNDLLYKPMKAEGLVPPDQLKMVFSCHKTLFKIHRQIYKILSTTQASTSELHHEPLIGKALLEIFEGELGKRLEKAASAFCACQSTNSELLTRLTRKDTKSGEFLAQVASQQMLGRLGIKDLLASCFQRLTKYPLLLENLLKATPTGTCGIHSKSLSEGSISISVTSSQANISNSSTTDGIVLNPNFEDEQSKVTNPSEPTGGNHTNPTNPEESTALSANTNTIDDEYGYERLCISRALNQSREILINVNESVKRAISHARLREIWKKTEKHSATNVIDIETQQLLHEGPLTLRFAKRQLEVYVILLTHYLVILTREGNDKYKLKNFINEGRLPEQPTHYSPIFKIDDNIVTRDTATDINGFYLLCNNGPDSRFFEFGSQSPTEKAKWTKKIRMAQRQISKSDPDDANTLTRYRELISLATSSITPNNIEYSPTNNKTNTSLANTHDNGNINSVGQTKTSSPTMIMTANSIATNTTIQTSPQRISSNSNMSLELDSRTQDVSND